MTFRQAPSGVAICNRSLSRLKQGPITSIDPPSPAGEPSRQCQMWYRKTVARLLETHHWGLATRRTDSLASIDTDRAEWLYAFEAPDDMAFPVGINLEGSSAGLQYYRGLAGLIASRHGRSLFQFHGRTIYSNLTGPLDYVSFDITESDFTETFENIVELSLAANICVAITGNKKWEADLRSQATSAMNMAITQNLNAGNPRYGDELSERDFVRGAYAGAITGLPWDWWPGR
jgi:hypothetical protein